MRSELGRARRRGGRILTPDGVVSPMDHNPTLEVSAAIIADCVADADQRRRDRADLLASDPTVVPVADPRTDPLADSGTDHVMDRGMRDAAAGRAQPKTKRDSA